MADREREREHLAAADRHIAQRQALPQLPELLFVGQPAMSGGVG
jgi:hypothetical protein